MKDITLRELEKILSPSEYAARFDVVFDCLVDLINQKGGPALRRSRKLFPFLNELKLAHSVSLSGARGGAYYEAIMRERQAPNAGARLLRMVPKQKAGEE